MRPVNDVTDATFASEVVGAQGFVVVLFAAGWCRSCGSLTASLGAIQSASGVPFAAAQLDVDTSPQTPRHYGVRGIPTLMVFRSGRVIATKVGDVNHKDLADWIDQFL